MADEITITASMAFSKGGIGSTLEDAGLTFDVSGTDYKQGTQACTTSEVALDLGAVSTNTGYIYMKNMDDTNYIEVFGAVGETATIKLKAGEVALFRLSATAPTVKADTANCQLDYLLIDD